MSDTPAIARIWALHAEMTPAVGREWVDVLLAEIDRLSAAVWTCKSCGCSFPRDPTIIDEASVKRCSKCVEVEALAVEVDRLKAENAIQARQLLAWARDAQDGTGGGLP